MKRENEDGFVLIATLWFVALLAFMGVIVAGWMARSTEGALGWEERVATEQGAIDATDEVAYLMVSSYFSQRGLEILTGDVLTQAISNPMQGVQATGGQFIALDNRPYRLGDDIVRLQDDGGLFNLNNAGPETLYDLLKAYGIRYEDRDGLADKLLDYTDKSTGERINGATADDYAAAGRPPPRLAPLLTPWEAYRVLGWDQEAALWNGPNPLPDVVTLGQSSAINPNTAAAPVLLTLGGMNDRAVDQLIAYRATNWILSPTDFESASGVFPEDMFRVFYFPVSHLRLEMTSPKDPLMHVIAIRRTPNDPAPYRIDYEVDLPQSPETQAATTLDAAPALPGSIDAK